MSPSPCAVPVAFESSSCPFLAGTHRTSLPCPSDKFVCVGFSSNALLRDSFDGGCVFLAPHSATDVCL